MEAECYLFGLASASRKQKLLGILAGYTAMKPVRTTERRIICQPPKPAPVTGNLGGSQSIAVVKNQGSAGSVQKDVFYAQLRKQLDPNVDTGKVPDPQKASHGWNMLVYETPDAQYKNVGLRKVSEIPLDGSFDTPVAFMESLGYTPINHQLVDGHRFAHGHINIFLTQTYELPKQPKIEVVNILPPIDDLKPVDPANQIVVHVYIRVEDSTNARLVARVTEELLRLKSDFEGFITLQVPERLSLDTRFK